MPGSAGRPNVKRILIAEDDPTNQFVIRAILVAAGFDVLIRENGEEALQAVRNERPDLILLDMMMPGMDGTEVCRRLRALPGLGEVPVVFLSARVHDEDEPEDPTLGPVTHLSKPFDPQLLVGLVRRKIGGSGP